MHEAVEVDEAAAAYSREGGRCREPDVDSFANFPQVLEDRIDAVDYVGEVMDAVAAVGLQELGIRRRAAERLDQLDLGRAGTDESVASGRGGLLAVQAGIVQGQVLDLLSSDAPVAFVVRGGTL